MSAKNNTKKPTQLELHRKALKVARENYDALQSDYRTLSINYDKLHSRLYSIKEKIAELAKH